MLSHFSCVWLCDPMNYSLPGSSVHGILQARILEWVAMPFSRGSSWSRDWTWVSCIAGRFFITWATGKNWHVLVASAVSDSLRSYGLEPVRPLCPRDSLGKNTGVGCHALFQGIFLTQGWNLGLFCLQLWQVGSSPLAPPRETLTSIKPLSIIWPFVAYILSIQFIST